ncbi:MAG: YggT family protein [Saccharofermentanales bacterium]
MEQMNKQTEVVETKNQNRVSQSVVGAIFGVIEVILAFRFIFKLFGANPDNGFVSGIYSITEFISDLFEGIFPKASTDGAVAKAVFEPGTLIAMVIIALLFWLIMALMKPHTRVKQEKTAVKENENINKQ